MRAFLTSTNVPTFAPGSRRASGRRYAKGPIVASSATSQPTRRAHAVAERRVDHGGVRPDLAGAADARAPGQRHALRDRRVRSDLDADVDDHRLGRREEDPVEGMTLDERAAGVSLDLEQIGARVDPERAACVVGTEGHDGPPALAQQREDPGQVALAADLVHVVERVQQLASVEDVGAEVDLADCELLGGHALWILRLHESLDATVGGAHHPAVAGGVEPVGGQDRRGRSLVRVSCEQVGDELSRHERVVAREDDDASVGARRVLERAARREHGRARALARALLGERDLRRKGLFEPRAGPRYAHNPPRPRAARRLDDPLDHPPPAHGVEDLRQRRAHARPVAGGHDEDGRRGGHAGSVSARVGADLSSDAPGEWCNRQHGTLWMFKTRFESWLPSFGAGAGSPARRWALRGERAPPRRRARWRARRGARNRARAWP